MPLSRNPFKMAGSILRSLAAGFAIAASAGIAPAHSHGASVGAITIGHLWSPESETAGKVTSVFGPVFNGGDASVMLTGISSPIAKRGGICTENDGTADWQDSLEIAPSKVEAFAKWREHICLEGVGRALKHGDTFPITLEFGTAGSVTMDVYVGVEGD
jgi:hypothetical protein